MTRPVKCIFRLAADTGRPGCLHRPCPQNVFTALRRILAGQDVSANAAGACPQEHAPGYFIAFMFLEFLYAGLQHLQGDPDQTEQSAPNRVGLFTGFNPPGPARDISSHGENA